jgi:hypothetical protein
MSFCSGAHDDARAVSRLFYFTPLQPLRKARRVAKRRRQHLRAETLAQSAKTFTICGELHGAVDVVVFVFRDPVRHPRRMQQALADVSDEPVPLHAQHGRAHPEGFSRRGAARVGERAQRDIHAIVGIEILGARRAVFEDQTAPVDSMGSKAVHGRTPDLLHVAARRLQEQARAGHGMQ